jgi:non-ribosomal peptide synthetase-like protein
MSIGSYMVPWRIMVMDEFPLTVNGKIDRNALTTLTVELLEHTRSIVKYVAPESPTEVFLCDLFSKILSNETIGIDFNFFELGGHSLLVMQAVLEIRRYSRNDAFSIRQFLMLSTARKIASHIDSDLQCRERNIDDELEFAEEHVVVAESFKRRYSFSVRLMKALSVSVLWVLIWISILPLNMILSRAFNNRFSNVGDLIGGYFAYIGALLFSIAAFVLCIVALSWTLCKILQYSIEKDQTIIRRNSFQYLCWYNFDRLWFVTRMLAEAILGGTIFFPHFYKLFGAKIGNNNFFEDLSDLRLPFMLTTGDNVVVETEAKVETIRFMQNGDISIGAIVLEENVVVGPNTHIGLGSTVGSSSVIKALSRVPDNITIPRNTVVAGVEQRNRDDTEDHERTIDMAVEDPLASLGFHFASLAVMQLPNILFSLYYIGVFVGILQLSTDRDIHVYFSLLVLVASYPFITAVGQMLVGILMLVLRLLLNGGRAKPRCTKVYSKPFLRQWLASKLYQSSVNITEGTIVSRCTSRLLGADLDIHCSFTPQPEEPNLTRTGKNVFCANGVKLRNSCFYPGGVVRFGRVEIGDSSMVLDRSVVETDTVLESNVMVASLTTVTKKIRNSSGSLLIGSPALQMIQSHNNIQNEMMEIKSEPLSQSLFLYFIGVYYQLMFVSIPVVAALYSNAYVFWRMIQADYSFITTAGISFAILPITFTLAVAWLLVISLVSKWLLVGNFQKFHRQGGVMSVDSWICFRWEIANAFVHMTSSLPLQLVDEFWLTAIFWKMMGASIGKRTMIDPAVLAFEADLLAIGDDCQIREGVTLFCHKFNNGGLEFGPVVIPSNTCIGARAVVLPGSKILDENVEIMPLTHILPSEELTVGTWHGSPAEKVDIEYGSKFSS